jgi:hypothetical protein
MGKLRLIRGREWYASLLDLHVYINDVKAGVIKRGDYKDFDLDEGTHEIFVKLDILKSDRIYVKVENIRPSMFRITLPINVPFSLLTIFVSFFQGISFEPISTDTRADKY